MVESSGLLNRRRVKNSTGGSNPPLSARSYGGSSAVLDRLGNGGSNAQVVLHFQGSEIELRGNLGDTQTLLFQQIGLGGLGKNYRLISDKSLGGCGSNYGVSAVRSVTSVPAERSEITISPLPSVTLSTLSNPSGVRA